MLEGQPESAHEFPVTREPHCRFCDALLDLTLVDFGDQPLSNAYLSEGDLARPEPRYPLHARVCRRCRLVQVDEVVSAAAIFSDYAYFSSYSETWMEHSRAFAEHAIDHFQLGPDDLVVELASNDGYLLQHFAAASIPVLGVEPAANVAQVAIERGIPTDIRFFGVATARDLRERGPAPRLVVANNVLAHVPDLNDFVAGIRILLAENGAASIEFPHLQRLLEEVQFDTIYHEHFSYFSLATAARVFEAHELRVVDVEELPTHGGSLRLTVHHQSRAGEESSNVQRLRRQEHSAGIDTDRPYVDFAPKVQKIRTRLRDVIDGAARRGETITAYGAAAKGNTLLNFCGFTSQDIACVADRNPHKQGKYLPGSRVPIVAPDEMVAREPDLVVILPWNLKHEIMNQLADSKGWHGRFVVPLPDVEVV